MEINEIRQIVSWLDEVDIYSIELTRAGTILRVKMSNEAGPFAHRSACANHDLPEAQAVASDGAVTVTAASVGAAGMSLSGGGLTRPVVFEADPSSIDMSGKFTLGIRPDKIEIVSAGEGEIAGTVRLVERLGTESHVHISLEDGRGMTAVVRGTHPVANGETVHLRLAAQHCYLFDAEGNAMRRRLDAETQALIDHEKGKRVV